MRNWRNRSIVFVAFLGFAQCIFAQIHNNAWFRGTLGVNISPQLKCDAEFQHRRQNGFDDRYLLSENLMFSLRGWLHYQYRENLRFSISPVAYFSNYRIIQTSSDEVISPTREIRFSAAAELKKTTGKSLQLIYRGGLEYRMFYQSPYDVFRLRNRVGIAYVISPKVKVTLFDEVFFNNRQTPKNAIFDQNRVGFDAEWKLSDKLKLNAGYLFINRKSVISSKNVLENNFFLNVNCTI